MCAYVQKHIVTYLTITRKSIKEGEKDRDRLTDRGRVQQLRLNVKKSFVCEFHNTICINHALVQSRANQPILTRAPHKVYDIKEFKDHH